MSIDRVQTSSKVFKALILVDVSVLLMFSPTLFGFLNAMFHGILTTLKCMGCLCTSCDCQMTGEWFKNYSYKHATMAPQLYRYFPATPPNLDGQDVWRFRRTMDVPVNSLHSQGYASIGCEPSARPVLPGQREREGRWWWEDSRAKEWGLHKGNIKQEESPVPTSNGDISGPSDLFSVVSLSRPGMENLLRLESRKDSWLVVLYAPWCSFCQGMEAAFDEVAGELSGTGVKVGKFRADGDERAFSEEIGLVSFPTILFFPTHASKPIKYPSEQRDVDSLLSFVKAPR